MAKARNGSLPVRTTYLPRAKPGPKLPLHRPRPTRKRGSGVRRQIHNHDHGTGAGYFFGVQMSSPSRPTSRIKSLSACSVMMNSYPVAIVASTTSTLSTVAGVR